MRIALAALCCLFSFPAFAQGNPKPVTIDRETGCWTSISDDFEWLIPARRAKLFMFVSMRNAGEGGDVRDPVLWLQGAGDDPTGDFEPYDERWSVVKLPVTGNYYLTYAPRAWFGTRGEVSICLRVSREL